MGVKTIGRFYFDSTDEQTVDAGTTIPFTSSTVSTKCLSQDNGTVTINASGAYLLLANVTYVASSDAEELETIVLRNSAALGGAHAISTATSLGDYVSQSVQTVITVAPYQSTTVALESGTEANVRTANLIIVKLA